MKVNYDYRKHPLGVHSAGRELVPPPAEDQTPLEFPKDAFPPTKERLKRSIGRILYPIQNRLSRISTEFKLCSIGADPNPTPRPTSISFGQKGTSIEILLSRLVRMTGTGASFASFGCGLSQELITVAKYLRPRSIIGYEFFNYRRAWDHVIKRIKREFGIPVTFIQADLRQPFQPEHLPVDILFSSAVLEHLRDMDDSFRIVRPLLRPDGWFAALWGPMWHSFSGDHIAAELGEDFGFEHVRLSPAEYWDFYRQHPRNRDSVARGETTWLEHGLSNFALYNSYIESIAKYFGEIRQLHWQLSPEAFRWRDRRRADWNAILAEHPYLNPLDLVLQCATLIARPNQ